MALTQLDLQVTATKSHSCRASTKKNLLTQLGTYQKFCDRYLLSYIPCDNRQLCRFGQHLSQSFSSPDAVGNYLSGIHTILILSAIELPDVRDRQMQMFTAGLKCRMDHIVKQVAPITPHILVKMSKVVNYKDTVELIAWTATLIGFYMFLRKSNITPEAMDKFNPLHQFRRADVNLLGLDRAMMIEVRWSKTLQDRQKVLRFPVLPAANKAICPVFWIHKMVTSIPGHGQEPLFLIRVKGSTLPLLENQLLYRLRKWLKLVGEDDEALTLHSLHRGVLHSLTNQTWRGR